MSDNLRNDERYVVTNDPRDGRTVVEEPVVERQVVQEPVVQRTVVERPVVSQPDEVYQNTEVVAGPSVIGRIISVIVWIISVLLLIRLVFKLLGANEGNAFSNAIYSVTQPLVSIFEGIFPNQNPPEVGGFLELSTVIALFIVIIIGVILSMLFRSSRAKRVTKVQRD